MMKSEKNGLPKKLLKIINRFDPLKAGIFFSGLTLKPELQSNNYRLESLIHFALAFGNGKRHMNKADARMLFSGLNNTKFSLMEDPAEDVMISLIKHSTGCYRLLEGLNEDNRFNTQIFVNLVSEMPDKGVFISIKQSVLALLKISDKVISNTSLKRYTVGAEYPVSELEYNTIICLDEISGYVCLTMEDLEKAEIEIDHISPFIFNLNDRRQLETAELGNSPLESRPLIEDSGKFYLLMPSSIGIAIRKYVTETCDMLGTLDFLRGNLQQSYLKYFHNDLKILNEFSNTPFKPFKNSEGKVCGAQVVMSQESGRNLHLVLAFDDFDGYENNFINNVSPNSEFLSRSLDEQISKTHKHFSKESSFREGKCLVVLCGWGRMMSLDFERRDDSWQVEFIGASDLEVLSLYDEMSLENFWAFLDLKKASENIGSRIPNMNGILNLFGWAKNNRNHLIPHEQLPEELTLDDLSSFYLDIGTNNLLKIRADVYQGLDNHCTLYPNGQLIELVRVNPYSLFKEDKNRPIYASITDLSGGLLRGQVKGGSCNWWLDVEAPDETSQDFIYRVWDGVNKWILSLDNEISLFLSDTDISTVVWKLELPSSSSSEEIPLPSLEELSEFSETQSCLNGSCVYISTVISDGFLRGFNQEINDAEKALILNLIEGVLKGIGYSGGRELKNSLLNLVFKSNDAKYVHAFRANEFLDFVFASLPKPILINDFDDTAFRIGLGFKVKDKSQRNTFDGVKECISFLNSLVGSLANEISEYLTVFDKNAIVNLLLLNHESITRDSNTWKRTVKANLALHNDYPDSIDVIGRHLAKNNSGSIASRLAIEMALCESQKTNSIKPGKQDIIRLLTRVNWLFHLGNLSDSIKFGITPPKIRISAAGEILYDQTFTETVLDSLGMAFHEKTFENESRNYSKNFDEREVVTSTHDLLEQEFQYSWFREFGFKVDDARAILDDIENTGINLNQAVFNIDSHDVLKIIERTGVDSASVMNFLDSLSLCERESWKIPPEGFVMRDILPWRFRRKLSLTSRPILKIGSQYVLTPGLMRSSFMYLLSNSYEGVLDKDFFNSKRMKSWIGHVTDKEGHEFNKIVARELIESGWHAESDIELSHLFNKKMDAFGDIDVLAWNKESGDVLLVECKALQFAKTPGEISKQLSEFKGEEIKPGKPDRLLKHLIRGEEAMKDLNSLEKKLKLDRPVRVHVLLLFSEIVPMLYTKDWRLSEVKVVTRAEIPHLYTRIQN